MKKNYKLFIIFAIIAAIIALGALYYFFIYKKSVSTSADSYTPGTWEQVQFDDPHEYPNSVHEINWGQPDSFNKVADAVNYVIENGVIRTFFSAGVMYTSIFVGANNTAIDEIDTNQKIGDTISTVRYRFGPSPSEMSDWQYVTAFKNACPSQRVAVQLKITIYPAKSIRDFKIIAKQATFNANGTITDSSGSPISSATVLVGNYLTTSGSNGKYTLPLPFKNNTADYSVTVNKSGYYSQTKSFNDSCGKSNLLNFQLVAKAPDDGGGDGGGGGDTGGGDTGGGDGNDGGGSGDGGSDNEGDSSAESNPEGSTNNDSNSSEEPSENRSRFEFNPLNLTQNKTEENSKEDTVDNSADGGSLNNILPTPISESEDEVVVEDQQTGGLFSKATTIMAIIIAVLGLGFLAYRYRGTILKSIPNMAAKKPLITKTAENNNPTEDTKPPINPYKFPEANQTSAPSNPAPQQNLPKPQVQAVQSSPDAPPSKPPVTNTPDEHRPSLSINEIQLGRPKAQEEDLPDMDI